MEPAKRGGSRRTAREEAYDLYEAKRQGMHLYTSRVSYIYLLLAVDVVVTTVADTSREPQGFVATVATLIAQLVIRLFLLLVAARPEAPDPADDARAVSGGEAGGDQVEADAAEGGGHADRAVLVEALGAEGRDAGEGQVRIEGAQRAVEETEHAPQLAERPSRRREAALAAAEGGRHR